MPRAPALPATPVPSPSAARVVAMAVLCAAMACSNAPADAAKSEPAAGKATAAGAATPNADTKRAAPNADTKAAPDAGSETLGQVLDGPLPVAALLGKTPAEVEAQLAAPLGKGMVRKSCVRFVPERTWYSCEFATQRYGDKSGAYKAIAVEYQDGRSTAVAFEGPTKASGAFDARAALAYVGLELPGEPKLETLEGGAKVYAWFNGAARLRIDGRQHRVVVSTVDDDWARTKVEVIMNDPLDESERARVVTPQDAPAQ